MASDQPCSEKPNKVWNYDKTAGRIIAASKQEELQLKGRLMIVVIWVQNTGLFCYILQILKQFICYRHRNAMHCIFSVD